MKVPERKKQLNFLARRLLKGRPVQPKSSDACTLRSHLIKPHLRHRTSRLSFPSRIPKYLPTEYLVAHENSLSFHYSDITTLRLPLIFVNNDSGDPRSCLESLRCPLRGDAPALVNPESTRLRTGASLRDGGAVADVEVTEMSRKGLHNLGVGLGMTVP
jgi:hypothetical protein